MLRYVFCACALVLMVPFFGQAQDRLRDDSDWWSVLRRDPSSPVVKPRDVAIPESNFELSGVVLGPKQFEQLATKFGKTEEIERGDASTGRNQVCYRSAAAGEPIHLVFEFGEVDEIFYLFSGGANWSGSESCAKSKLIDQQLSTKSGLKLGLSRTQVEAILGPADMASGDRIYYSRVTKRKTTPEEFERMRKQYPEKLTDEQAHEEFDYFDLTVYIEVRFERSKLVYLVVDRSETD